MNASTSSTTVSRKAEQPARNLHSSEITPGTSAVSWGAIFAGAAGATALSLILLILGMGLGLLSISPWSNQSASMRTIGLSTIVWLTFMQLVASGMGGYLAGRLRLKWATSQRENVYFCDTAAHGFLAWAVATLVTVALVFSMMSSMVSVAGQAGASVAGAAGRAGVAATGATVAKSDTPSVGDSMEYFVDLLFRKDMNASTGSVSAQSSSEAGAASSTSEVARIFSNSILTNALTPEDTRYIAQLIAQRTGISQADAEKRVTAVFGKFQVKLKEAKAIAQASADKVRKASSYAAFWLSVSLLSGAFFASFVAVCGSRRQRL